jgi:hypothetical protein
VEGHPRVVERYVFLDGDKMDITAFLNGRSLHGPKVSKGTLRSKTCPDGGTKAEGKKSLRYGRTIYGW